MLTTSSSSTSAASLPQRAYFKARVYWAEAPAGTAGQMDFYSFDTSGRYKVADPRAYGLRGLRTMVDKMGARVARCIIYDNQAPGRPEYCRKEKGSWNQ